MSGGKAVKAEGEAAARERCLDGRKGRQPPVFSAKDRHRMAETADSGRVSQRLG
jgi:hypothetical protein